MKNPVHQVREGDLVKREVRHIRFKIAGRNHMYRAVHKLVPLLPAEDLPGQSWTLPSWLPEFHWRFDVNLSPMEKFDEICESQTKKNVRKHCFNRKIGTDLRSPNARQSLIAAYKFRFVFRCYWFLSTVWVNSVIIMTMLPNCVEVIKMYVFDLTPCT